MPAAFPKINLLLWLTEIRSVDGSIDLSEEFEDEWIIKPDALSFIPPIGMDYDDDVGSIMGTVSALKYLAGKNEVDVTIDWGEQMFLREHLVYLKDPTSGWRGPIPGE